VLVAAPAATGQGAPGVDNTGMLVSSGTFGGTPYATVYVASSLSIARATVYVPQGYAFDLNRAPGAEIGAVLTSVTDAAGGFGDLTQGTLVSDDPAKYAGDAVAQSCAPGPHAAVWRTTFAVAGRSLELPIFVDPAGPADPAGAAFVLRTCPVWPSTEIGVAHRTANLLVLAVEDGLTVPTGPGRYSWSAIVTPTGPLSVAAEPSRTFEVRATVPLPRVLTLRAKHDPKAKTVLLSGRLTTLGVPEAGVPVELYSNVNDPNAFSSTFDARTNANGEFQVRRRVVQSTQYVAAVDAQPGPCGAPSSAPAGCVSETLTPPGAAYAAVVLRAKTDPKLAARARDRALAREAALKLKDFPTGWEPYSSSLPIELCTRFKPDLSALTATGEWDSPAFLTDTTGAASSTTVYATVADARTAFRKEAQLAVARCLADDARDDADATVHSVGPLSFPRVGHETRAFRVVAEFEREGVVYLDLISLRRGRVVVHMWVSSIDVPLDPLERSLAAAVAARAG
jgi:hypothetical protein